MTPLLATDLLLLAWDDGRGRWSRPHSDSLPAGVAGALVLDAVLAGLVATTHDRLQVTGVDTSDPLLTRVVDQVARSRRPAKITSVIQALGTRRQLTATRGRLEAEGFLRREERRHLGGLLTIDRWRIADPVAATALHAGVRDLLVGGADPNRAEDRLVALAALAGATALVDSLVDRSQRTAARRRAKAYGEGDGVSPAVRNAISATQAATIAAMTVTSHTSSATNA